MRRATDEALVQAVTVAEELGAVLDLIHEMARAAFDAAGSNRDLADFALDVANVVRPQMAGVRS